MWGSRYLAAYAVGTVVGIVNEYAQKSYQPCYQDPNYSHVFTLTASNIYGWSVLAMTAYFDLMARLKAPSALTILMIAPLLTAVEAIGGGLSRWCFKEERWRYPKNYLPFFGGTVSVVSSLYFAVGGFLYWWLVYKPFVSRL